MIVRKTIALDSLHLGMLKPLLEEKKGNLSLAVRDLILKYSKGELASSQTGRMRDFIVDSKIGRIVPVPIVKWFMQHTTGCLPSRVGCYRVLMDKYFNEIGAKEKFDLAKLADNINQLLEIFGDPHREYIILDDRKYPKFIQITFELDCPDELENTAKFMCYMYAHEPAKLKPVKVVRSPTYIKVDFEHCESEEEAYRGVLDFFGQDQILFDELDKNPEYWRNLATITRAFNYDSVFLPRSYFNNLMRDENTDEDLDHAFEAICGELASNLTFDELIESFNRMGRAFGLIRKIDHDGERIAIYYTIDNTGLIERLNKWMLSTLQKYNHKFQVESCGKVSRLGRESESY